MENYVTEPFYNKQEILYGINMPIIFARLEHLYSLMI